MIYCLAGVIDSVVCFFFQAEDGIRDLVRSRGLGDVYKRQAFGLEAHHVHLAVPDLAVGPAMPPFEGGRTLGQLSLIHI